MKCAHCHTEIPNPRPGQRFCSGPGATCRQQWHAEQGAFPGQVYRITKNASGEYTTTVRVPHAPAFNKGDKVKITSEPRPDASQTTEQGGPEQ